MNHTDEILVSIICLTYNQVSYIRQCLDGFIMQNTDFNIEVIIHDDASTDGTTEIIREYQTAYPNIIKPIIQSKNQYSQNKGFRSIINSCLEKSSGLYIAFCEGDDYWIDSNKLKTQINIIKSNNADLVYTDLMFIRNNNIINSAVYKNKYIPTIYSYKQLLAGTLYMAPCTWLVKRKWFTINHGEILDETFAIALDVWSKGKVVFLNDATAAYRIHENSVTHKRNPLNFLSRSISLLNITKDSISKNINLLTKSDCKKILSKRLLSCIKYSYLSKEYSKTKTYYKELIQIGDIISILKGSIYVLGQFLKV